MAAVISVERVVITLAAGVTSNSAALSKSQTIANCIPFVTKRITTAASDADDWSEMCLDVYFSGSSVYVATIQNTPRVLVVEITVVEFDPNNVTVQQGTFQLTSTETSTTEAPSANVVQANTFLVACWKVAYLRTYPGASVRAYITDVDEITFERKQHQSVQVDGHWFVAESDEGDFAVEECLYQINNTQTSASHTLSSSVTDNKTLLVGTQTTDTNVQNDNERASIMTYLADVDTVTSIRDSNITNLPIAVYVIKFAGDESVERGQELAQGATSPDDVTIGEVDLDVAMPMTASGMSTSHGSFPGTHPNDVQDAQVGMILTSITNLRLQHSTGGGEADNDISWQVIEWAVAAGGISMPLVMLQHDHFKGGIFQ